MKTNVKVATAVCAAVVALGMIGCGGASVTTPAAGGDDNGTVVTVIPDYAKKVDMNLDVAKGALNIVYGEEGELYAMVDMSTTAQESQGKYSKGMSKIPYMLLNFLEDFTYKYYDERYIGKAATSSDDHNVTLTFSCAYSGSYTVHEESIEIDMHGEGAYTYLKEYTFDACEHNAPINMRFDTDTPPPQYRFNYSGNLKFVVEEKGAGCCSGIDEEKVSLEANSFVFSVTENGKKVQDLSANFAASFDIYEFNSAGRYDISMDGDVDAAEYNATSGEKVDSFAIKTKEYQYRGRVDRERYFDLNMDGYAFIAPDMNASHAGYLYGDGLKVVWQVDANDDDLWNVRFDGVLGTACLGGSVEFDTTAAWDVNDSMPNFDGDTGYPQTPYAGRTTITGASSTAEITFGKTSDPKSWAQIGMVGETPEPKTTIQKIMDENCTIGFFD